MRSAGLSTLPHIRARPVPRARCSDLVVVGGVPGAGKSTAIARVAADLDHVTAVDPEQVSSWLRRRLPPSTPYRRYRWLVHSTHLVRAVAHLLAAPVAGRRLVIHDPGTREGRRLVLLALARWAGWRVIQLYIDVDRAAAREGQRRRGRLVGSFGEHWRRWERLRPTLLRSAASQPGGVRPVLLVDRSDAADALRRLCT